MEIADLIAPIEKASSIYETAAWGSNNQPDYLNQVILINTALAARNILEKILVIELSLGRQRKTRWDSRTIDIDILFYGDAIIEAPDLQIPHKRMHERRFTLEPLAEIAPGLLHPLLKKTVAELKNELTDNLIVKKL